jgi:hypothetical protein
MRENLSAIHNFIFCFAFFACSNREGMDDLPETILEASCAYSNSMTALTKSGSLDPGGASPIMVCLQIQLLNQPFYKYSQLTKQQ